MPFTISILVESDDRCALFSYLAERAKIAVGICGTLARVRRSLLDHCEASYLLRVNPFVDALPLYKNSMP